MLESHSGELQRQDVCHTKQRFAVQERPSLFPLASTLEGRQRSAARIDQRFSSHQAHTRQPTSIDERTIGDISGRFGGMYTTLDKELNDSSMLGGSLH